MRTLAEALAEREFYARSLSREKEPAAPTRREQMRAAAGDKLALLSGFAGRRFGTGDVLKKAPAIA